MKEDNVDLAKTFELLTPSRCTNNKSFQFLLQLKSINYSPLCANHFQTADSIAKPQLEIDGEWMVLELPAGMKAFSIEDIESFKAFASMEPDLMTNAGKQMSQRAEYSLWNLSISRSKSSQN